MFQILIPKAPKFESDDKLEIHHLIPRTCFSFFFLCLPNPVLEIESNSPVNCGVIAKFSNGSPPG